MGGEQRKTVAVTKKRPYLAEQGCVLNGMDKFRGIRGKQVLILGVFPVLLV